MRESIDIKAFFIIMKTRVVTILVTLLFVSSVSAFLTYYVVKPTYEATEYILVGTLKSGDSYVDAQTVNRLMASSIDFITSPIVLNSAQKKIGISRDELEEKLNVVNNSDSQIINIIIRDTTPEKAQELANVLSLTAVEKMKASLNVENISLLSGENDESSIQQINNPVINLAIGVVAGLFLGIAIAMLKDYLDDTIRTSTDLEKLTGMSLLGVIVSNEEDIPKQSKNAGVISLAKKKREELSLHAKSHS